MQILNVVNTVFELYYLSSVGYLLQRAQPGIRLRLLITPQTATKLNPELASLYSDVQTVDFPAISGLPLKDVRNSLYFRRQLRKLDLNADIICISSFREYFANILCRYLEGRTRLVALRMANQENERLCQVKKPLRSLYLNFFNYRFGASTMEYRWHSETAFSYTYWFRRDPYQRTISISDWGHGQSGENQFRLPPPFVALRHYYSPEKTAASHGHDIVLIGERTPLFENWDAQAQSLYEHVFDFLRQNFVGYGLLCRPRTGFTDVKKMEHLLKGFKMMPSDVPFEELCLRHNYSKVISVKSTACKVAAYCGQPAYVLYPMFEFPLSIRQTLDAYLADMQAVAKVQDLNELLYDVPNMFTPDIDQLSALYTQAILGE